MAFEPRVKLDYEYIEVDLRRNVGPGSAVNQYVKDPNTEVYFGDLYAKVTFVDLRLRVEMDPFKGDWKNASWARKAALDALKNDLTPDSLQELLESVRQKGYERGVKAAKAEIRNALGIKEGR